MFGPWEGWKMDKHACLRLRRVGKRRKLELWTFRKTEKRRKLEFWAFLKMEKRRKLEFWAFRKLGNQEN